MKFNMNTLKIGVAVIIALGAIFWAIDSNRTDTYTGSNLAFDIGGGAVTITNPSDEVVPVQVVGTGARTFKISSTIEDVSGSSTRVGSGTSSTQLYEFALPSGTNTLSIANGTNARFETETDTRLQASVNLMSTDSVNAVNVVALVIVAIALTEMPPVSKSSARSTRRALPPLLRPRRSHLAKGPILHTAIKALPTKSAPRNKQNSYRPSTQREFSFAAMTTFGQQVFCTLIPELKDPL